MNIVEELPIINKKRTIPDHNTSIELVRLLACFGVISIHIHADTFAAHNFSNIFNIFCVPFFFITGLVFFINNLNEKVSINTIISRIWKRIGIPFIAWSTIYSGLILTKSLLTTSSNPFTIYSLGRIYLYGESSEQLYFLPDLAVMQIISLSIYLIMTNTKAIAGLGLFFLATFYLVWGYSHNYYGITPIKSIIIYILFAFFLAYNIKEASKNSYYLYFGIIISTIAVAGNYLNTNNFLETYLFTLPLGGIGLFLITLYSSHISLPKWAIPLTPTTYGVYLSHIVFLEATEFLIEKLHYKIFYDLLAKVLMTSFIFIVSIIFILIVKKINILRILLLGERRL